MALAIIVGRKRARRLEAKNIALQRKHLRDHSNVFEMPEEQFISKFRMDKQCFRDILEEVTPFIPSPKTTTIPAVIKLCTFLRFIATGSQKGLDDYVIGSITQKKVSQIIAQFLNIFERHICPKHIVFEMSEEEEFDMMGKFYNKFGLPGIIGCVDGMHVKLKEPPDEQRHLYFNQKGFYSLNVMIICDFHMIIRFVDARSQGAVHDSYIWRTSKANEILNTAYVSGKRNTWLLGDSEYPLLPYLLIPYPQPQNQAAVNFNTKLCEARNIIKRCIDVLKNRFRSIGNERGLNYSPIKCTQIINTCCALHNICVHRGKNWDYAEETYPETLEDNFKSEEDIKSVAAEVIRDELAQDIL